jgi:hypothetical protein
VLVRPRIRPAHCTVRGDLGEFQAVGGELEDAPLGHVEYRLAGGGGVLPAEGPLLDVGEKLGRHGTV